MAPGPALAAWLAQSGPAHLDEAGLVNSITGWRKLTSWAQAQELAAVAELGRRRGVMDDPELKRDPSRELSAEFAPNEVALALTLTQCAAEWWMSLAVSVSRRLPATWSALSQGTIDLGRAKLIDQWTTPLDDDLAGAVERKVLVRAGQQTTGQLRASLQRAVISADPAAAERRRTQAEKHARVELSGEDSGTAALSGRFLPAAQASAAWARISGLAEALKGDGAGGGIDLLRAQVFLGLLLGTPPQPPDQASPGNPEPPGASPLDGGTAPTHGRTDSPGSDPRENPRPGPRHVPPGDDSRDGHSPASPDNTGDDRPCAPDGQPWCWPPIPRPGDAPWTATDTAGTAGMGTGGTGAGRTGPGGTGAGAGTGGTGAGQDMDGGTGHGEGMDPGQVRIRRPELRVPWRTLAGRWDEPGQLTRIGAVTAAVARELARVAAADPACQWRIVVTGAAGQVIAVTQVRRPGWRHRTSDGPPGAGADQPAGCAHPPRPGAPRSGAPRPGTPGPSVLGRITVTVPVTLLGEPPPGGDGGPDTCSEPAVSPELAAALSALLARAAAAREASDADGRLPDGRHRGGDEDPGCTHASASPGYRIPDWMRSLIEARDQDCGFPICRRPAARCDLDHTVPYDQGGLTCPCNISAGCRHDHRMKGSTAWRLKQPRPGTLVWTSPAGLFWTVTPVPHVA